MRNLFKLIPLFFRVCWEQGLHKAVMLTADACPRLGIFFWSRSPFPQLPSNAAAYLPLLKIQPKISVIMPVYNSRWLDAAAQSVLGQSYRNFELIVVDDASTEARTLAIIDRLAGDRRVRVIRNRTNLGISAATNAGIGASQGDYVAFMDHDDLLHPDALALFARALNDGRNHDIFYTDEVRINARGFVLDHIRKCPISLDLLLSCNAVLHFLIVKKSSLLKLGPLNPEFDGAQDHELLLRALDQGLSFGHLPLILYAWRIHAASKSHVAAPGLGARDAVGEKAYAAGKRAIQAYLARKGIQATVTDDIRPWFRVKYALTDQTEPVAMIVPFKDRLDDLKRLLQSLDRTSHRNFEVWLVNNRSTQPDTNAYLNELKSHNPGNLKFLDFNEPFNYSRLHNQAVAQIPNALLLFLNSDVEVVRPDWLECMLEHIHRENVGAVGCRLIRPNGTLQHAGMVFQPDVALGVSNLAWEDEFFTRVQRDVSGVTAACMLVQRSVFQCVGGFDEVQFPIGFSDADLCLKIIRAGYKIIYTPFAELYHHESASRRTQAEAYEKYALFRRYIGETPLLDRHYKLRQ